MTADQWQRVKELFEATLALEPEARSRWLDQACHQPDIRSEVESLLAAHDQAGEFIQHPPAPEIAAIAGLGSNSRRGETVGPWRLIEEIGRGGMGTVWRAERADGAFQKQVAVKLVSRGLDTDLVLRYFQREREILASLSHTNITAILDGGTTSDGLPYFVMEYVDGSPITSYCRDRALPLRARLDLFCTVCDAVAYAHRNHVLHRDLKPSNILVTAEGVPKLLDFGIAKVLAGDLGSEATLTTGPLRMLTPEYASPEQVRADPLTTAADVYSLGVLLYELAADRRPYEFTTRSPLEIAEVVCARAPVKPSAASGNRDLKGDLDSIVMMALRKESQHRYPSARDLAADVRRHLAGEPVRAARGTVSYNSARLVRRYGARAGAALAVLVVVSALMIYFPRDSAPQAPLDAVAFTTLSGREKYPSFSPNGELVAFTLLESEQGSQDIYVKAVRGGDAKRITTHPAPESSPAWSPDGRRIAFLRDLPGYKAQVVLVPSGGGAERVLAEAAIPAFTFEFFYDSFLAWSPDGRWLAIPEVQPGKRAVGISLLSTETTERRTLTSPPETSVGDSGPAFSPKGDALAFTRSAGTFVSDLFVVPIDWSGKTAREPQQLTSKKEWVIGAVWSPDGRELVYSSGGINRSLYKIRVPPPGRPAGDPVKLVGANATHFFGFTISWSKRLLVYARDDFDNDIWRMPLRGPLRGSDAGQRPASRFISSTLGDLFPQYSPDGDKIAFMSHRSGSAQIWVANSDGSNPRQVGRSRGVTGVPRWSPDSAEIVFDSRPDGISGIFVAALRGGDTRRLTQGAAESLAPSWSRNGQWIYFVSPRTGTPQVWKMPAQGGPEVQVTRNGGFGGFESADGRTLYYAKDAARTSLWKVPVEGGDETLVLDSLDNFANFAVTAGGIYFSPSVAPGRPSEIRFFSFGTKLVSTIATLAQPLELGISVSPDTRWILYTAMERRGADLMLVEGFMK